MAVYVPIHHCRNIFLLHMNANRHINTSYMYEHCYKLLKCHHFGLCVLSDLEMQSLGKPLRKQLIRSYCSERNRLQWKFCLFPYSFVNTSLMQVDDSLIYDIISRSYSFKIASSYKICSIILVRSSK